MFCMRLEGGRGSHGQPGLMARWIGAANATALLSGSQQNWWIRKPGLYGIARCSPVPIALCFQEISTPQGPVDALVFVMDQTNRRYMPHLTDEKAAQMIAVAEGGLAQFRLSSITGHTPQ